MTTDGMVHFSLGIPSCLENSSSFLGNYSAATRLDPCYYVVEELVVMDLFVVNLDFLHGQMFRIASYCLIVVEAGLNAFDYFVLFKICSFQLGIMVTGWVLS